MIESYTQRIEGGEQLTREEMADVVDRLMQGQVEADAAKRFLLALRARGETVAEIAGAASAMRRHMTPIRSRRRSPDELLDTCGTGGDGSGVFNISTAAAIVVAATGVAVAKHGNRSITSRSGSADVLAALGVRIEAPVPVVEACLDEVGICFCFAPLLHPAMKHVAPIRKSLGVPTIFNLLGPLANPAGAACQLLGVGKPHLRELLAEALLQLGVRRAAVVCGEDGFDEVALSGPTNVTLVAQGKLQTLRWTSEDFGLAEQGRESLRVDGPEESASVIREVLAGRTGAARDIVLINAAAALWTAGRPGSLVDHVATAAAAIDSGAAATTLKRLAEVSSRC